MLLVIQLASEFVACFNSVEKGGDMAAAPEKTISVP